jgi:hypothetical protein
MNEKATDVEKFEDRRVVERENNLPVKATDQQSAFFASIERLVANPNVDVAKIKQIMEMQEHVLDRDAEQSFNAAMTRAQNKIELVVAKSENTQTDSKYANLKTVLLSAKPIYTAEGFSLMFYEGETPNEKQKRVCVDIMHEQGHTKQRYGDFTIQTTGIAGKAMMTQIHGEGSAFSYGRRYLTCLIFNIPTGDDDNGNAAGKTEEIEFITVDMKTEITDFIKATKTKKADFLKYIEAESIEKIPLVAYGRAISGLQAKEDAQIQAKAKKEAEAELVALGKK